jgi:4-azaleucine resistance transporter AzlC
LIKLAKFNYKKNFKKTVQFSFKQTIPILFGYLFIGIAFGLMLQKAGYHWLWAPFCSFIIYAGSLQYVLVVLLTSGASLLSSFIIALIVNGRQIFYGISLIDKFKGFKKLKPYMIFSLTDETYSIFCSLKVPEDIDEKEAMFLIALFNQTYWIMGSLLGAIIGDLIGFNSKGIEFAMTALFTVILIEYLKEEKNQLPALLGICSAIVFLLILEPSSFILPSLLISSIILVLFRKKIEERAGEK